MTLHSKDGIAHLPWRPRVRPPHEVRHYHVGFSYRARSWDEARRVVADETMRAKAPACQGAVEHALDGNGINLSKVKNLGWKTDYVASEGGGDRPVNDYRFQGRRRSAIRFGVEPAGLPCKTGVGGGIFSVAPGKMAIVGFPPSLNEAGNCVRAWLAVKHIAGELKPSVFGTGM